MNLKEQIAVMQAKDDGKQIEYRHMNGNTWREEDNPVWDWHTNTYRVLVEEEYVPYTQEDLISKITYRNMFIKTKGSGSVYIIDAVFNDGISVAGFKINFARALGEYTWYDGSPFGRQL